MRAGLLMSQAYLVPDGLSESLLEEPSLRRQGKGSRWQVTPRTWEGLNAGPISHQPGNLPTQMSPLSPPAPPRTHITGAPQSLLSSS